jgi:D-serine deaminase-like pyridoxal phosphate-dependent protein
LAAAEPFETPLAIVDESAMEANLARMSQLALGAGLALRPHAKTHKSPFVAARQLAHGARGLTVATLLEAEVFAENGARDLLIAHPPVGEAKLRRLRALAEGDLRLAVALDSAELAGALPEGVEVLWEVDSGLHRLGTPPGPETVRGVLSLLAVLDEKRFRGLLTHGGHAYAGDPRRAAVDERDALVTSALLLRAEGIAVRELSVGSTPTAGFATAGSGLTEMRPGTYVFGDANQVTLGSLTLEDCALGVVSSVVSRAAGRAVLDAGSKALSADLKVAGLEGYGMVLGRPGARLERLSEEHGVLVGEDLPALGERVLVVPAHACTTVNLHPALLFAGSECHWEPVAARGWR